jgi:hypothetical protein
MVVFANTEDGWVPGKVVRLWDQGNPYRIKLKGTSTCVFAPEDTDAFVRAPQNQPNKNKKKK